MPEHLVHMPLLLATTSQFPACIGSILNNGVLAEPSHELRKYLKRKFIKAYAVVMRTSSPSLKRPSLPRLTSLRLVHLVSEISRFQLELGAYQSNCITSPLLAQLPFLLSPVWPHASDDVDTFLRTLSSFGNLQDQVIVDSPSSQSTSHLA